MKNILKISGIAYVMIFLGGFYANFAVLEGLVDFTNPAKTMLNLSQNHAQYGYGLLAFVLMLLFDLLLVWTLFEFTKSVSRKYSYLASLFRLLHASLFSIALFKLWKIYFLNLPSRNSIPSQQDVMQLLSEFDFLWTLGLLFFGIHLAILAYLLIKSDGFPRLIASFIMLAALGYLIDTTAKLAYPNYFKYQLFFENLVVFAGVIGELSFTIWLLYSGFNKKKIRLTGMV